MNAIKAATVLSALGVIGIAAAQAPALYGGFRSIGDQKITLRGWGSGTISQTDELALEGTYSLRVSTRNFFQGGIITFGAPVDLATSYGDPNNLLRMTFQVAATSTTLGGGGGTLTTGGGGAGRGRGGGALEGGGPGQEGRGSGSSAAADMTLKNVRFIVTTSDGKKSEAYVALSTGASAGWKSVAIPLRAISGFEKTNKSISAIAISGDAVSTFYVGELKVVNDSTPLNGEMQIRGAQKAQDLNLALGDEVEFRGSGFGGSSVLRYTWIIKDAAGEAVEVEGQMIKRRFRTAGDFTVTLMISDGYGLKQPYMTSIKVKVNP